MEFLIKYPHQKNMRMRMSLNSHVLVWVVARKKFHDLKVHGKNLWGLWAFCSISFKGVPLNLIQFNWRLMYSSKGVG